MTKFATVEADLVCPYCGEKIPKQQVGFLWGYCSVPLGNSSLNYRVGDPILWRLDSNGSIPAWSYFSGIRPGIKSGDPAYTDLIVRNDEVFGLPRCPKCGDRYIDLYIVIRRGIIQEMHAITSELPRAEIFLIGPNDQWLPKPVWSEHSILPADDGNAERLVPG